MEGLRKTTFTSVVGLDTLAVAYEIFIANIYNILQSFSNVQSLNNSNTGLT